MKRPALNQTSWYSLLHDVTHSAIKVEEKKGEVNPRLSLQKHWSSQETSRYTEALLLKTC